MLDASPWRDFFVMVGGGAASLTGLVFVAMSMHLTEIAADPAHRHRARTILTALTTVFIRCGLVLMGGQSDRAVGAEVFSVVLGAEVLVLWSLWRASDPDGPPRHAVVWRTLSYTGCLLAEQAGAALVFFGHRAGLYAIGGGMMASIMFIVSGAWLLLVGVDTSAA